LTLPADLDPTEPQHLIAATDGSVLFYVGHHSWVVSTKDKEIIISGGGPDDGAPHQMTSYRSELGGICAGMAVIVTMARSGKINMRSVRFLYENEAAVKRCMFHNKEGDWDLGSTLLIPQVRPVHKYPNSHWEIIHPPGEIMQYVYNLTRFTRLSVTSHSQPLINAKYKFQVTNYLQTIF
jgi:hypothetical protein